MADHGHGGGDHGASGGSHKAAGGKSAFPGQSVVRYAGIAAVVIVGIWMLGHSLLYKGSAVYGGPGVVVSGIIPSECPGGAHPLNKLNLGKDWTAMNPNGCRFIYDIKQGALELTDGQSNASADGWIEFLPTAARVTSGPLVGNYAFCPTKTGTKPIDWNCNPV